LKIPPTEVRRITATEYAEEAFPDLYSGMSEFVITSGAFSMIDLMHYVLEFTGPAFVDSASWCGSYKTMRSVHDFLLDGRMLGFRMMMDGGAESIRGGLYTFIRENIGDVVCLMANHAKFTAFYNDSWAFVIETSANLTKSSRAEQYRITEDADFCAWIVEYFDSVFAVKDKKEGILVRADVDAVFR
jgi:hypothetical protein